jgi:chromosome segregation ATPase
VASYPSDELAERRARRDGRNVVFLDGSPVDGAEGRLAAARHDVAVLQARVGETVAERDRMSALASTRREQLGAAREREAALRVRLRVADGEVARVRAQLAARAKSEASLRVEATGLHARIHALRAHAAGHDARVRELQVVVDELTGVTSDAGLDVERQLAARETAEEALAAERARVAELEDGLASAHAELEALHAARDRTLGAEERVRAARAAELAALRVSSQRLRPIPAASPDTTLDLAVELARAAERLRAGRAADRDGDPAPEPSAAPAPSAVPPPAPLPPPRPAAIASPRAPARAGGLRGLLHRLLAGCG